MNETQDKPKRAKGGDSLRDLVRLPWGYCIARWLLNRWLWQNPRRVVPILQDLHRFAEVKLTALEYQESVQAWEYVKDVQSCRLCDFGVISTVENGRQFSYDCPRCRPNSYVLNRQISELGKV